MAMKRDVANTIGSANMRKGRIRATERVFLKFCFLDKRGVGLVDCPTHMRAARARRAYKTGPYVSICRLREVLQTDQGGGTNPEETTEE